MEIWRINPSKIRKSDIEKMAVSLKKGKILVVPTDTVYGLVAKMGEREIEEKIFKIKKRKKKKPFLLFVPHLAAAKKIAVISEEQERFLKKVWPGKVTVVFKKRKEKGTIGLRIPHSSLLLRLLKKTGPLLQTSANISNKPALSKIEEVIKSFHRKKHQPDIIIDAGDLPASLPSTIIDFTVDEDSPRLLRPGAFKIRNLKFK